MKSFKKIVVMFVLAFIAIAAFGCNISFGGNDITIDDKGNVSGKVDFQSVFNAVQNELGDRTNIMNDIVLPASKDGVSISWSSNKPDVISNDGKVNRQLNDTEVQLSCLLRAGEESKTFYLTVIVKGNREQVGGYDKISDVLGFPADTTATVLGTVVAIAKQSLLVKDDTGLIYCYGTEDLPREIKVGTKLEVAGAISIYGGFAQFNKPTLSVKGEEAVTQPTATELTKEGYEGLLTATEKGYYKFTAKLSISGGKYFNLTYKDSEVAGSLVAPREDVTALDGKNVDVEGYFVYVSGSAKKYIYFLATSVKESANQDQGGGGGDNPPVDATEGTIAEIIAAEVGKDYKTEAIVVAVAKQGLLVKDDSGMMYCYSGADVDAAIVVGKKVEIVGKTSSYGGFVQFDKPTVTVKGEEQFVQPNATALTKESYEALLTATSLGYYSLAATLTISSGKYFNLAFEGSEETGALVAPREDLTALDGKKVDVEGYFVYVTGSSKKYIYFIATSIKENGGTVTPIEVIEGTIAEIIAGTVGNSYKTTATVVAVNTQSFLLQDESGYLLSYLGTDYAKDLEVGDVVTVEGKTSTYQGSVQFNRPTYTKTGEKKTVTYPNPTVLTAATFDALNTATPTVQYVEVVGETYISNDKYVNFYVNGASVEGSIAYPMGDLSVYADRLVKITGFYTYAAGSDVKYIYIIATKVEDLSDAETVAYLKAGLDATEKFDVYAPLLLFTETTGCNLTWSSSNPAVLGNDGKLVPPAVDTEVTLTATISKGEATATASFVVNVKAPETIASILALETLDEKAHLVSGTVVALYKEGFLVKDATGYILVYRGANFETALVIGDQVTVYGTVVEYGGARQFGADSLYGYLGSSEFTQPEPRLLDKDAFEALATDIKVEYVKLRAKVVLSGKYVNLTIADSTLTGSLANPTQSVSEFNGKEVDITGYFVYFVSDKYLYFVATVVEEAVYTDAEYVAHAEADLLKMNGKAVKKDLELPAESNKCTITWASQNTAIIANDGKFTMPSADTEVKLVATIVKGNESKNVEITVVAKYVDPNAKVAARYDFTNDEQFLTWAESYVEHTLEYDEITVYFEKANNQRDGNAIDDMPVTKGFPIIFTAKDGTFEQIKVAFKQWGSKEKTATLSYSVDGETFVETTITVTINNGEADIEFISEEGVKAIKITFDEQSNQVGIASVEFLIG